MAHGGGWMRLNMWLMGFGAVSGRSKNAKVNGATSEDSEGNGFFPLGDHFSFGTFFANDDSL